MIEVRDCYVEGPLVCLKYSPVVIGNFIFGIELDEVIEFSDCSVEVALGCLRHSAEVVGKSSKATIDRTAGSCANAVAGSTRLRAHTNSFARFMFAFYIVMSARLREKSI